MNKKQLIDFEKWVCEEYHKGNIKSPVHLSGGNEKELIEIFKQIKPHDWIFTTYRSHYHALLKGMPKEELQKWILENKSIHLMNKEHKIVSSAIVGGTLSQAVGCAMALKIKKSKDKVWVFCGDMTASLGLFRDCLQYSINNKLPIKFIIEDNGLSTDTPTNKAWGVRYKTPIREYFYNMESKYPDYITYYHYKRKYPHYGVSGKDGKRVIVNFDDKKEEIKT